ncbi:cysteine desulfurase, partial [Ectothiorhodospiraceae bacterium WFHF3C12]|nr:cysteine desulfurase [Ectothiorhodospiraceae bacterium WFHF3C12]
APGRRAAALVERARRQVADAVGAEPREIVWTSGATEANNLALRGVAAFARRAGRACHILTAGTEHASVLETLAALEREGVEVTRLPVDEEGRVDPEAVAVALRPETRLVSIMHVNNETGVRHDLPGIAAAVAGHGTLLHVDAAQSFGKVPLDLAALPADLVSLSAHKVYGPKGAGALFVRAGPGRRLEPLLRGGGQEGGLRSGTVATHQVAGMGLAFELASANDGERDRLQALTDRLRAGLAAHGDVFLIGGEAPRAPHILSLVFAGVHARALQALLPGVASSVGSACNAPTGKPSHVLRAMGIPDALAQSVLRLSVGRFTTEPAVDEAVSMIGEALMRLRQASPLCRDRQYGASWQSIYGVARLPAAA